MGYGQRWGHLRAFLLDPPPYSLCETTLLFFIFFDLHDFLSIEFRAVLKRLV